MCLKEELILKAILDKLVKMEQREYIQTVDLEANRVFVGRFGRYTSKKYIKEIVNK